MDSVNEAVSAGWNRSSVFQRSWRWPWAQGHGWQRALLPHSWSGCHRAPVNHPDELSSSSDWCNASTKPPEPRTQNTQPLWAVWDERWRPWEKPAETFDRWSQPWSCIWVRSADWLQGAHMSSYTCVWKDIFTSVFVLFVFGSSVCYCCETKSQYLYMYTLDESAAAGRQELVSVLLLTVCILRHMMTFGCLFMLSGWGLVWLRPWHYLVRFRKRSNFSYLHDIVYFITYVAWVRYWTHIT